jgi:hypothetical protein
MSAAEFADYIKIDAVNWSTLKHMRTSPLHYRHAVDSPDEDTTRFGIGRAIHTAILEPHRLSTDYAVFEGARRSGKAWEAFEAENIARTILKRDEMSRVQSLAARVASNDVAQEWLGGGNQALIERSIQWTDPATGIACKARPDAVHSAIVDVKSTSSIDERQFRALATRMGYFGQLAFYRRGYKTLTKLTLPCAILAVEVDAPHDIGVFVVDDESLRVADDEITRLLAKLAECRKTNEWPGRYQKAQTMTLPDWALGESDFNFGEAA